MRPAAPPPERKRCILCTIALTVAFCIAIEAAAVASFPSLWERLEVHLFAMDDDHG